MGEKNEIQTVEELLAHALALEQEAAERYRDLADQMDVHNNPEVSELFARMSSVEKIHVDSIKKRAKGMDLPHIPPWEYKWLDFEPPEMVPETDVHYLMTPYHALSLALTAEERGYDFYMHVTKVVKDESALALATELAEEEREHVELMKKWLAKYPKPDSDWNEDPDPPVMPT
ncbi:MAG: ferritin family protein [Rhodospirillales bacterium]|nr:ferritin family protein [Rhodospirillales bacterium]